MPKKSGNNKNREMELLGKAVSKMTVNTVAAPSKKRKSKKKKNNFSANSMGTADVRFSRCELLVALTTAGSPAAVKGGIEVWPSKFSFLGNIAKVYDNYRWNSLEFYYKPAVGTTVGGMVSMGMDWNYSKTEPSSRTALSGLSPNVTGPLWQDTQSRPMRLPTSRIMTRQWYSTNSKEDASNQGPGRLLYAVDCEKATMVGEIWCKYSIHFSGTNL